MAAKQKTRRWLDEEKRSTCRNSAEPMQDIAVKGAGSALPKNGGRCEKGREKMSDYIFAEILMSALLPIDPGPNNNFNL